MVFMRSSRPEACSEAVVASYYVNIRSGRSTWPAVEYGVMIKSQAL